MSPSKLLLSKVQTLFLLLLTTSLLVSCSRDGRELRVAGPGQGESIAIVTTTVELFLTNNKMLSKSFYCFRNLVGQRRN